MVTTITIAAISATFVILYFTNASFKRKIDELLKVGDVAKYGPIVDRADNITFEIVDDEVPPNSSFTVAGEFTNADGTPVRVKKALYYVVNNANGRELITQGDIGVNVGKFSKVISTSGFPSGNDYDVIVSDSPISIDELQTNSDREGAALEVIQRSGNSVGGVSGLT